MTTDEYLLTKLGEECNEIAQRVSKVLCFGLTEQQPDQEYDNASRLLHEVLDFQATLEVLVTRGLLSRAALGRLALDTLPTPLREDTERRLNDKIQKIFEYRNYARDNCGTIKDTKTNVMHYRVPGIWLPGHANPKHQDLSSTEVRKGHRVIGGDLGDVLFDGYDLETFDTLPVTVLREPVFRTTIETLTPDEAVEKAQAVIDFSFDSVGLETVEHS